MQQIYSYKKVVLFGTKHWAMPEAKMIDIMKRSVRWILYRIFVRYILGSQFFTVDLELTFFEMF